MAGILRGEVRRCDFGDAVGHELSGHRYGLVLSDAPFNRRFDAAVVAPVTGSPPVPPHRWHIPVCSDGSWAAVRQLRTVAASRLKKLSCTACLEQMDDVSHAVTRWLGEPSPVVGHGTVVPGGIYRAQIPGLISGVYESDVLVLDYSPGNCMAVVMVASVGEVGNSVLKVPFQMDGDDRMRVVHAHQMRTISEGRLKRRLGAVSLDVINQVKTAFSLVVS